MISILLHVIPLGRILVCTFWFFALIFTSTYTANLAAYYTSTKKYNNGNGLEDLLKDGYSFTAVKQNSLGHFFATSEYNTYKRVYERITLQETFVSSFQAGVRKARSDAKMIYIEETPIAEWFINKKPCDLRMGKLIQSCTCIIVYFVIKE